MNFVKLKSRFTSFDALRELYTKPDVVWYKNYAFELLRIENKFFEREPWLLDIINRFGAIPKVMKIKANTLSQPHTDHLRPAAINIRLDTAPSHAFFCKPAEEPGLMYLEEIDYGTEGDAVLMNTRVLHTVVNLQQERYTLSIGLFKNGSFKDLAKYCEDQGYL